MRQLPEGYEKGFHEPDGTVRDYLNDGWEISFVYQGIEYDIDATSNRNIGIIEHETGKIILDETYDVDKFLDSKFYGKTVLDILENEAYITELH